MTSSSTTRILVALLAADLAFVLLHLLDGAPFFWRDAFRIDLDGSIAEFFQYGKAIGCGVILVILARRHRAALLWFAAGLAFFLFLEDAGGIHEFVGGQLLGPLLAGETSNESYNAGQFWYGLAVSAVIAVGLIVAWRGASADAKRIAAGFVFFVGVLGFAAIVVDRIPTDLVPEPWFRTAVGLVEEGGEHLAMTGALWWLIVCLARDRLHVPPEK